MDHGPVDAGPSADADYTASVRSLSPSSASRRPQRRAESRNASKRRSGTNLTAPDHDEAVTSGASSRRQSSDSSRDPPAFLRVGATAAREEGDEAEPEDAGRLRERQTDESAAHADQSRVYKFTLYETNARYWITGVDLSEKVYRLLRIDRTSPPGQIGLFEDETTYGLREMNEVLLSIDEGNKATGGLRKRYQFWGVLGFIRFTEAYYMLVITKRQQVAMIGGHYIYQIESTELVPLTTGASSRFVRDRNPDETRFLNIFNNLDLSKSFYFSYAYDITNSLQHNIIRQRQAINDGQRQAKQEFNSMFVWNHHLLQPAIASLKHPFVWCLPIIHGFIDQAALDIFGRAVFITIIGRRSRFFAGARFLKRGVNDSGYVANDVETEQIVSEKLTTSFHAPGPRLYSNPTYTSFLHHRGSIPLFWTQDNSGVTPKPDINLNLQDPFYQPAALHFDHLFQRYGCPVYVLNLIKSRERTPRESKLLVEFQKCIDYLNQSLPHDRKILYKAFDMSRASKTRDGDVIGSLELIAKEIVGKTGFFRNGDGDVDEAQVQNGIARTNCIDCLDRTNAAQFVLGKRAFALQLQALGVINCDTVDYDTDAVNIFTHMFHDHGDTIAVQYGGSHLVNTMATYRKLNHWQSSSRDMVESFKRYYHNSFLDNQRQEAYNLFLGNYVWVQGRPMLWDLTTDYYLHHSDPRAWLERKRRNYITWFTPESLEPKTLPPQPRSELHEDRPGQSVSDFDSYWLETYRPTTLSSLGKVYTYRMTSSNRFLPERPHRDSKYDFSPFKIRVDPHRHTAETPEKRTAARKGVTILEPQDGPTASPPPPHDTALYKPNTSDDRPSTAGILREPTLTRAWTAPASTRLPSLSASHTSNGATQALHHTALPPPPPTTLPALEPGSKAAQYLWTLDQFHAQSLNPSVSPAEAHEYERYIAHPLHLPLVVSAELPSDANRDYIEYVRRGQQTVDHGAAAAAVANDDALALDPEELRAFADFLEPRADALTVFDDDGEKKRYKAYRQWMRGKSLFKQSKVDPEFRAVV